MQSIRQYHKFRHAVQAQYEREKEKATNQHIPRSSLEERSASLSSSNSSSGTVADPPNALDHDPEKGSQSNSSRQSPTFLPSDANQPPRAEDTAPHKAEPEELDPEGTAQQHNIGLERTHTHGTALGLTLTGINVRSRTTHEGKSEKKVFVVGYEGDADPLNPHNWSYGIRIWTTFLIAGIGFVVGVASSIDSSALPHAAKEFHVSEVVESLATGKCMFYFKTTLSGTGPACASIAIYSPCCFKPLCDCSLSARFVSLAQSVFMPMEYRDYSRSLSRMSRKPQCHTGHQATRSIRIGHEHAQLDFSWVYLIPTALGAGSAAQY
jgi:hypothetical protein